MMKSLSSFLSLLLATLFFVTLYNCNGSSSNSSSELALTLDLTNEGSVVSGAPYKILVFKGTSKVYDQSGTLDGKQKEISYSISGEHHFYIWIDDDNSSTYDTDELGAMATVEAGLVTGLTLDYQNFSTVVTQPTEATGYGGLDGQTLACYMMPPGSNAISGVDDDLVADHTQVEQFIEKSEAVFAGGTATTIADNGLPGGSYDVFCFVNVVATSEPPVIIHNGDYISVNSDKTLTTVSPLAITLSSP
jgi:hypothetical protein